MSYDVAYLRAWFSDESRALSVLGVDDGARARRRLSNGMMVRCPIHGDRTPSLHVSRTAGGLLFYCHGCEISGDFFSILAAVHRLSVTADFLRVVEIAAQAAGITEGETYVAPKGPPLPPAPPCIPDDAFGAIVDVIASLCPLESQPDVCAYVKSRGLYEAARGELLALPANRSDLAGLTSAIVAVVGHDVWVNSGLATKDGGWLWREHRLCIPWRLYDGTAYTMQRRLIRPELPHEEGKKYVLASARERKVPWGVHLLAEEMGPATELAFVEGCFDALAMRALCHRNGIDRFTLGLPGVGWRQSWAALGAGRQVVLALDNDKAGNPAAEKIAPDLWAAGACDVTREIPKSGHKDWCGLLEVRRAS